MSGDRGEPLPQDELLTGLANWWFRLIAFLFFTALVGVAVMINSMVGVGLAQSSAYVFLGIATVMSLLILVWLNRVQRDAPRKLQEFLWRLGLYRRRDEEEP